MNITPNKIFLSIFLISLLGSNAYSYYLGKEKITNEWNKAKLEYNEEILFLKSIYSKLEDTYKKENSRISNDLAKVKQEYETKITDITNDYSNRLLESANRESIYKRNAESGSVGCRNLSNHAAKLDKALTEGIQLVEELTETIKLRDEQLKLLGDRLKSERELNR